MLNNAKHYSHKKNPFEEKMTGCLKAVTNATSITKLCFIRFTASLVHIKINFERVKYSIIKTSGFYQNYFLCGRSIATA